MTREEAKNWLNKLYARADITDEYGDAEDVQPYEEAINVAINSLEQEPSDNAVSRQAVIDVIFESRKNFNNEFDQGFFVDKIRELPSVNPQRNMGHWIKSRDRYGNNHFTCPFCDHDIATKYDGTWKDNYCSNCGAKMESEDRNENRN